MKDITKYIGKDSNTSKLTDFYADLEEYENTIPEIKDIENGDIVGWTWETKKYVGIIRDLGSAKHGMFEFEKVQII